MVKASRLRDAGPIAAARQLAACRGLRSEVDVDTQGTHKTVVPSCPSTERWRVASGLGVVTAFIHSSGVLCCTAERRPLAMAPPKRGSVGF